MVEHLVVPLKVVSSNLGKGIFFIIENKVIESMTMVAPSGEQIKSLKSYRSIDINPFTFRLIPGTRKSDFG